MCLQFQHDLGPVAGGIVILDEEVVAITKQVCCGKKGITENVNVAFTIEPSSNFGQNTTATERRRPTS